MRILVTGSRGQLGSALVRALARQHEVRTLDRAGGAGPAPEIVGDARERAVAERATAGCEVIIQASLDEPTADELERLDSATRGTYNLLTTATAARRFILLSRLSHFERYPVGWRVNEYWAPRPTTAVDDLVPHLAELTVQEAARVGPLVAIGLRLGEVVDDEAVRRGPADPRWLHIDDAVAAVERALDFTPPADGPTSGWWLFHIVGAGQHTRFPLGMAGGESFGYTPRHALAGGRPWPSPVATPSVRRDAQPGGAARRVVIYGAGGPLAAVTAEALAHDHTLRLTDRRPLSEIVAEARPQSPDAPLPRLYAPPHEQRAVDITDLAAVGEAARGMDAIINCTVMRPHPVEAFRVNTLGAYTVMRAALAEGIRRVVHTGPQQVTFGEQAGYWHNFALDDDVPPRPGRHLYILTKFLGQEICRLFAEEHGLEVPTLLFSSFVNPTSPAPEPLGAFPFSVSWADAADAMRLALRAPAFPRPFEVFNIVADLPHGKYRNEKAKRLLGWQPRDTLADHWTRGDGGQTSG